MNGFRLFHWRLGCLALVLGGSALVAAPYDIRIQYYVLTARTSPHNPQSLATAFNHFRDGAAPNDGTSITTHPAALNIPPLLRIADIVSSPPGYAMWDGTNHPTGPFASENGKRLGVAIDVRSTNRFLVSDVDFDLSSSDTANSFRFSGNLATNADNGALLSFSVATLVGETWDLVGNATNTYTTGVVTSPVNRVVTLIRLSYPCNDSNLLALTVNYFASHLPFTNFAACHVRGTNGAVIAGETNHIESLSRLRVTNGGIVLHGQRNIPNFSYTLEETADFETWNEASPTMVDGAAYTNVWPVRFFRAKEELLTTKVATGKRAEKLMPIRTENGAER